jgi:peptidoglycan/LPS O-acetylase OafA/YrhL
MKHDMAHRVGVAAGILAAPALSAGNGGARPTYAPANGQPETRQIHRVDWLDGIRGAAAMFVVLHHMWLAVWPAFPRDTGPWWLSWLLYGHLAVAVFIVVSGFSLALAPMRHGGTLNGGPRRFLRRRAWRILPPYWVALVFSTIIAAYFMQPIPTTSALARGFVVHAVLLQDITGSLAPNGAFWSIAIEWQIYFVFPLILLFGRKTSLGTAVMSTVGLVLIAHYIAGVGSPWSKLDHLTPQFLALFSLGVLAVYVGQGDRGAKLRRPLMLVALAAFVAFVSLALVHGSVWMVARYFWIDLLFGFAVACLLAGMSSGGGHRGRRLLASRVGRRLGLFSYSIYLMHAPLVGVLAQHVFGPLHLTRLVTFTLLLAVGLPVIILLCYGFHLAFEAPFLEHRGWSALRALPIVQLFSASGRAALASTGPIPTEVAGSSEAP